jgi:hypothetical protein
MNSLENSTTKLRRTPRPYVGIGVILIFVSALVALVATQLRSIQPLIYTGAMWIPYIVWLYIGSRYKVYWDEEHIFQRASGVKQICISFSDIEAVQLKSKMLSDAVAGRPFIRIEISDISNTIDISLKHFKNSDIKRLMQVIISKRPDVYVPRSWT